MYRFKVIYYKNRFCRGFDIRVAEMVTTKSDKNI